MSEAQTQPATPGTTRVEYEQLPNGQWRKIPDGDYRPQSVSIYYLNDSGQATKLPLDVEEALSAMRAEIDSGNSYGMLCGFPKGVLPKPVHARTADEWDAFEAQARPWLEAAIKASRPPDTAPGPDTLYVYRYADGRTALHAPDIDDVARVRDMLMEALRSLDEGNPIPRH